MARREGNSPQRPIYPAGTLHKLAESVIFYGCGGAHSPREAILQEKMDFGRDPMGTRIRLNPTAVEAKDVAERLR